ncbi:hypothetical protein Tco_0013523 [Tanacetum coccineum]
MDTHLPPPPLPFPAIKLPTWQSHIPQDQIRRPRLILKIEGSRLELLTLSHNKHTCVCVSTNKHNKEKEERRPSVVRVDHRIHQGRYDVSVPALTKDHRGMKINTPFDEVLSWLLVGGYLEANVVLMKVIALCLVSDEPLVFDEQLVVDMIDDERVLQKTAVVEEVNRIFKQLVKIVDDAKIDCTEFDNCCSKEV